MLEEIKFDPDELEKALGNAVVQDEPIEEEELKADGEDKEERVEEAGEDGEEGDATQQRSEIWP